MQHCQFFHKSKIKKGKFTHLGGSSVNSIAPVSRKKKQAQIRWESGIRRGRKKERRKSRESAIITGRLRLQRRHNNIDVTKLN